MTVADDLRAGATYIRKHGHAKGKALDSDGSACAMGGIALGMGAPIEICYGESFTTPSNLHDRFGNAVIALSNYLQDSDVIHYSVANWNDMSLSDDVITAMEKAAAWFEEKA